ncbi:histidine kinase, partial [Streptomyces sp. NPDC048279]
QPLPVRPAADERAHPADAVAEGHTRPRSAGGDAERAPLAPPARDHDSRPAGPVGCGFGDARLGAAPDGGDEDPVTSKGLPKRTPKITTTAPAPRQRGTGVDADALRRRLGGFRSGADAGRRDVQAEIAEQTGQNQVPSTAPAVPGSAASGEATGGTVEEASS